MTHSNKFNLIRNFLKNILVIVISIIITFGASCNSLTSFAETQNQEGYLNGYVNPGFTNKVNNPKYNDFSKLNENIDPLTGTVSLRQSDISFSGREGLNLEIARLYNSSKAELFKKKANHILTPFYRIRMDTLQYMNGTHQLNSSSYYNTKFSSYWDASAIYEDMIDVANTSYQTKTNATKYFTGIINWVKEYDNCCDIYGQWDATGTTYLVIRVYAPALEYDEYKGNELLAGNYGVDRYDLGEGWSFAFPSIEYADGGNIYYHDGNGGAYRMISDSNGVYSLEDYYDKDISINNVSDSGGRKYTISFKNSINYSFNYDGTIDKISDRFGNRIKFSYTNRAIYNVVWPSYSPSNIKPFISKITDSVGRVIDFEYENKIDSGADGTYDLISLYVTEPLTGTKKKLIEYKKKGVRTSLFVNGVKKYEYNYPILDSVKKYVDDTKTVLTRYGYEVSRTGFDFWKKSTTEWNTNHIVLNNVLTDTAATKYVYEVSKQNLGKDGLCEEPRCKQRYDILHDRRYYDSATNSWKWNTGNEQKLNLKNFSYPGISYTGYSANSAETYSAESDVPDGKDVIVEQVEPSGQTVKTVHKFFSYNGNKRKRLYSTFYKSTDNSYYEIRNSQFNDTRYPFKPSVVDRYYKDKDGKDEQAFFVYKGYNEWGGLAWETKPIISGKWSDETYKDKRKTLYEYDTTYKSLKKKTWWQNDTTQLFEENTYENGRIKTSRNAKGEIINYSYETVTTPYAGESTSCSVVTKETVTKALENSKVAKTETYYDVNKGSLPVKTISYFSDEGGNKQSTVTMAYDMLLGLLKTKTEQGNTTTYEYDYLGREKSIKYPNYTDIDNVAYEVTDNFYYTPGYYLDYDELASESFDSKAYDGIYGLLVESEKVYKSNGIEKKYNQTKALYDAYGNLRIQYNYDYKTGRWIQETKNIFDNVPRLVASIDANGSRTSFNYDAHGNVSEIIDIFGDMHVTQRVKSNFVADYLVPAANIQTYRQNPHYTNSCVKYLCETYFNDSELIDRRVIYKSPNRLDPVQESYKYDISGNVTGYIDPKRNLNEDNNTNTYYHDSLNRLVKVKNALNQIVDIKYNLSGEVESVSAKVNDSATSSTEIYKKSYTETGKQSSKTVNGTLKLSEQYNVLGLAENTKFKNLNTTKYYYDQLNRTKKTELYNLSATNLLQSTSYLYNSPFGASEIRTSDDTLAGSINDKITFGYNYNANVDSKKVDYSVNGIAKSILTTAQFNDIGRKTKSSVTGYGSSYYTNYFYDKTRLDRAQLDGNNTPNNSDSVSAKFTYYDNGKIDTIQYPVSVTGEYLKTKYTYNSRGYTDNVKTTLGTKILSEESYLYDNNGNVEKVISKVDNGTSLITTTSSYSYDKLNRLQGRNVYDAQGNLLTFHTSEYDLLGNNTRESAATYNNTLNEKEQVVGFSSATGSSTYKYGQDGLRYQKTTNGKTYSYSYDENSNLVQLNDGTYTDNFSWANGQVYSKKDGKLNKTYYYIYNGFGDVVQLVDSSGNIANSYTYNAWGNPDLKKETVSNPFRYRGYVYDDETNLYYLKARYYDPVKGRFTTEDTYEGEIENLQSMNQYVYCENNPLRYIDPSGKFCILPLLLKAGAGGATDLLAQAAINYLFNPETQGNIEKSFKAVDWGQVIRSAGESILPWTPPGGRWGKAAFSAAGDVLANFAKKGTSYSTDQAVQDFAMGFISGLAGDALGDLISKYGTKVIVKGMKRIGIPDSVISKIACFTADTRIQTKHGYKNIQDIKVGDEVYSENPETGEKGLKRVKNIFVNKSSTLVHVFAGREEIRTTTEHPFWVTDKGWVGASRLEVGDKLLMSSGKIVKVSAIKLENLTNPINVYNFEVEDWHTYFVSDSSILVHNTCTFTNKTRGQFWDNYDDLPKDLQKRADEAFALFKVDPNNNSLNFEKLQGTKRKYNIWSVRINGQYRAYGEMKGDVIEWFEINAHDYDTVVRRFR